MVTKMAKGRKLTASWSERLLGSYSYSYSNSNSHERIDGGESELEEDDVWSTVDGMANDRRRGMDCESGEWSPRAGSESGGRFDSFRSRRHRQRVPRTEHHRPLQDDGSSLTFDDLGETTPSVVVHQFHGQHDGVTAPMNIRHLSTSVPVNIPNWSNLNRVNSVESSYDSDHRDFEMVPPHEYLAREHGRTAANSMCEGAGRTLKGRDMSRVRDAVWSRTGFNG